MRSWQIQEVFFSFKLNFVQNCIRKRTTVVVPGGYIINLQKRKKDEKYLSLYLKNYCCCFVRRLSMAAKEFWQLAAQSSMFELWTLFSVDAWRWFVVRYRLMWCCQRHHWQLLSLPASIVHAMMTTLLYCWCVDVATPFSDRSTPL